MLRNLKAVLKKILLIRFSSIGDIVLTTPVVRCIKKQLPDVELHVLTKAAYHPIYAANPYINKVYSMLSETLFLYIFAKRLQDICQK